MAQELGASAVMVLVDALEAAEESSPRLALGSDFSATLELSRSLPVGKGTKLRGAVLKALASADPSDSEGQVVLMAVGAGGDTELGVAAVSLESILDAGRDAPLAPLVALGGRGGLGGRGRGGGGGGVGWGRGGEGGVGWGRVG